MTKPIVIVSIVILLGLGYFAWQSNQISDVNNTETESQAEVTNIVNDSLNNLDVKIDENKNKSEAKEEKEKVVINTITGENVPEGFYDEVLADGYTYNNPKTFDISIVTPNDNPYIPGYIMEDQVKNLSESWLVPNYPSEEYTGGFMYRYMEGTNYHELNIGFPYGSELAMMEGKEKFSIWFSDNYGYDFVFVRSRNYQDGAEANRLNAWNILILGENLNVLEELSNDLEENFSARIRNSRYNLHKYRGTELEKIAREKAQEFFNRTLN